MTNSPRLTWCKSSYSGNGGSCVEWAPTHIATTGTIPVRDSKNPTGPILGFSVVSFASFIEGVKAGEFGAV
ncbi:DUF397 domain-containing protein [Streptomyces sp. 4R-3d]|uniref:DUF397 domain-containing protein n=1 Tax=Streptomyces sp. 4R-3d TaxID=2559605 RepID=UPI0010720A12|nr:DUF397 domain-containing protein [Streptomyces sp. 4R-3d]TFI25540.1 DUF397 domain-containing protein [Streptomyces sp. 4R-3d]